MTDKRYAKTTDEMTPAEKLDYSIKYNTDAETLWLIAAMLARIDERLKKLEKVESKQYGKGAPYDLNARRTNKGKDST